MDIKVFDGQTLIRTFKFPIGYYANKMATLGYETVEFSLEVKKNESFILFSNHAKEHMIYLFPDRSFRKELWEEIPSEVTYEEVVVIKDMLDFIGSH